MTFQSKDHYDYVHNQLKTLMKKNRRYDFIFDGTKLTITWTDDKKSRIYGTYKWIWKSMMASIFDMPTLVIEE